MVIDDWRSEKRNLKKMRPGETRKRIITFPNSFPTIDWSVHRSSCEWTNESCPPGTVSLCSKPQYVDSSNYGADDEGSLYGSGVEDSGKFSPFKFLNQLVISSTNVPIRAKPRKHYQGRSQHITYIKFKIGIDPREKWNQLIERNPDHSHSINKQNSNQTHLLTELTPILVYFV